MEEKQPTIQDVFEVLKEFKQQTEQKFEQIDSRFDELGEATQELASHMDARFDILECRMTNVESAMVTKEYLDRKLYAL